MRINFDRMSRLAGLSTGTNRNSLNEGAGMHYEVDDDTTSENMDNLMAEEDDDAEELRRAKGIMQESKRRRLSESRKKQIFQRQLKQVIDEEVSNVMDEMNLSAGWVYGNNKPRNSRQGYTSQGSFLPGMGFKR